MVSFILALFLVGGYRFIFSPPSAFPSGTTLIIARGTGVSEIARELSDAHIIAHPTLLQLLLRASSNGTGVQAGMYRFSHPENLFVVAYRLTTGAYDIPPTRVTLIEGTTVREYAERVANALTGITVSDFVTAGKPYEGYLFPDTYLFVPGTTADAVVVSMRANFNTKVATISSEINASGHSLSDIVTMASLVEKEGRTSAVRRVVAGILWNRLAHRMPLQVDAVFGYIYNRDTYSPSLADLKVDSPYNTYTHTGLPPGPINNPGLDSLEAALNPTATNYLYYLTDKSGVMHYATTYAGHVANQQKYLR